jgi:hypothetical protein
MQPARLIDYRAGFFLAHIICLIIDIVVDHIAQLFAGNVGIQLKNFLLKQSGGIGSRLFLLYPVHSASLPARQPDTDSRLPQWPFYSRGKDSYYFKYSPFSLAVSRSRKESLGGTLRVRRLAMKEFMLLIRNEIDHQDDWSAEKMNSS